MLNLIDLPTEILINIFQKSTSNKYQLIRLSKTTRPITQPIAYHHITLTSHQSIRFLTATLRSNPELAPLIHSITLVSNPTNHHHYHQSNHHHHLNHHHHHHHSPKQNHDESMTFFAFTALLRYTHHITHLELDLEGSNIFELTQLFEAISQSKSASSIRSLTYLTRSYSSLSTEPDLTQLVSNLTSLTSLSIIGNTRYSNSFHHHPLTTISHHTTLHPSSSNHRHTPNSSLPTNSPFKLLPPIKSLTISSSRLTSNSPSNIQKLIKLCSSTLTELTICGVNEIRRASSTQWTEAIQDKLEKLTLVGSFFHGDQHESSLEILAPDWSSLISKFVNLKSLKLINNFNWLDSIPILIPITSPITATIIDPPTSTTNPDQPPQVDLSILPQPSSSSNDASTTSNTITSPENQATSSTSNPHPNPFSSSSIINNISKPTYYLDYSSLETLPKSLKEIRIETEMKVIKGKNAHPHHHQDNHDDDDDDMEPEVTSLIDNHINDNRDDGLLLSDQFTQYFIDFDLNWKPSHLWSCLENLDLLVFNHSHFFRPPPPPPSLSPDLVF